ncbi:MAG: hypothetical protein VZT48_02770 [Bulleidia sp.]|nr:hypothetical protein [Bulleidia sp.]
MKKQQGKSHTNEGFASVYFLGLFLSVITVSAMALEMQDNRMKAALNSMQANLYAAEEAAALSSLQCMLKNEKINDAFSNGVVSGSVSVQGDILKVEISAPCPETLFVTYHAETKSLDSYEVNRNQAVME